jgi:hypothetical protein
MKAATSAAAPGAAAKVRARVLFACALGRVDEVVELDPDAAARAVAAGEVDTSADAVAYALSLRAGSNA